MQPQKTSSGILCIGEALIDMICTDVNQSLKDGNHFLKKAGGAPTNVAAAIAALGGQVSLAACVGQDPFGDHLIEVLNDFAVDTKYVRRDANAFTTIAYVSLMESGERDFYFNRGADALLSAQDLSTLLPGDYSIAHFGSATAFLPGPLQDAYRDMLLRAKAANCFISFDPNYRELLYGDKKESFVTQSLYFLQHCDFYKMSEEEAMMISAQDTIEAAAGWLMQKFSGVLAITLGKNGALLGAQGQLKKVAGVSAKAIDTTGAGDAFVGAVLAQLLEQGAERAKSFSAEAWAPLISNANTAGARTCEYMGAMEAYRHLSKGIFSGH